MRRGMRQRLSNRQPREMISRVAFGTSRLTRALFIIARRFRHALRPQETANWQMETAQAKARRPGSCRRLTVSEKAAVIQAHERLGCSQRELGRRLGLAQSVVSNILRCKDAILSEQTRGGA